MNLETAFHRYSEPPAILTATFTASVTITAYVHKEGVHATIHGPNGWIATSTAFTNLNLPYLHILPQIAPLQPEETLLTDDHVGQHYYTRTGSRHFRNQIQRNPENFANFKTLVESTWHGLRIAPIHRDGTTLTLLVTDGDFAAEAAWMGHGLQMWLQTIWFIAKTPATSTVILDEPDVYMHPDLQRRLYRLVTARFAQRIIATHSVEIMAEADPSNILIIDNKDARSEYADNEPAVQELIDHLGGIHNIHLARLWNAKRVILVEGKDLAILKTFHSILYPNSETPLDTIPNWSIGGWGGWTHAIGGSMAYKNAFGDRIVRYCILDSDYHTSEEQQARYQQATERGINLHIWHQKEIENYLLNPSVVERVIKRRTTATHTPTTQAILDVLDNSCVDEKDTVLDGMPDSIIAHNRKFTTGANKIAREQLAKRWANGKREMVSGKTLLARVSEWSQQSYGVSIGAMALARAFHKKEIPVEMRAIITNIEEGTAFPAQSAALT